MSGLHFRNELWSLSFADKMGRSFEPVGSFGSATGSLPPFDHLLLVDIQGEARLFVVRIQAGRRRLLEVEAGMPLLAGQGSSLVAEEGKLHPAVGKQHPAVGKLHPVVDKQSLEAALPRCMQVVNPT